MKCHQDVLARCWHVLHHLPGLGSRHVVLTGPWVVLDGQRELRLGLRIVFVGVLADAVLVVYDGYTRMDRVVTWRQLQSLVVVRQCELQTTLFEETVSAVNIQPFLTLLSLYCLVE